MAEPANPELFLLGGALVGSLLAVPTLWLLTSSGALSRLLDSGQGYTVIGCLCLAVVATVQWILRIREDAAAGPPPPAATKAE
jgi:hypothetical protein